MENLDSTIGTFSKHLSRGGVLIIEPMFTVESFRDRHFSMTSVDNADCKIARVEFSRKRENIALLEMQYLIATQEGIRHMKETHHMGLFSCKDIVNTLEMHALVPDIL